MKNGKIYKILCAVYPIGIVAYLVYCKINCYFISTELLIFIIIGFILSLIPALIKKIPTTLKTICSVAILAVTAFAFCFFYTLGGNTEFRSYNFAEIVESYKSDDAPTAFSDEERFINEIDENSTAYKYFSTGLFQQLSYTIITKYDEDDFNEKIAEIDEKYSFCEKTADDGEDCPFNCWEFNFRLIYSSDNSYPKQMRFIGINDTTKEIAYITFEDGEIDSVSDFSGLLANSCGWMYIANERNYLVEKPIVYS